MHFTTIFVTALMALGVSAQVCHGLGNCCGGSGDTSCCAQPNLYCKADAKEHGCYHICAQDNHVRITRVGLTVAMNRTEFQINMSCLSSLMPVSVPFSPQFNVVNQSIPVEYMNM
ncbi:hypothetical protein LA080_009638 [Diaporthe eres]|nr:hypothetical protein LA080_009638 [Diaporthe eres]